VGGSTSIGGGSSEIGFKFNLVGGSGVTGLPAIQSKGESGQNAQTILDPLGNLDRISDKITAGSGVDALNNVGFLFDMETNRLLAQRDAILNRINESDIMASKVVRESRINKARQTGRSSTILSR
jgi:hypothetical protein